MRRAALISQHPRVATGVGHFGKRFQRQRRDSIGIQADSHVSSVHPVSDAVAELLLRGHTPGRPSLVEAFEPNCCKTIALRSYEPSSGFGVLSIVCRFRCTILPPTCVSSFDQQSTALCTPALHFLYIDQLAQFPTLVNVCTPSSHRLVDRLSPVFSAIAVHCSLIRLTSFENDSHVEVDFAVIGR